jgi:hypothetical protein
MNRSPIARLLFCGAVLVLGSACTDRQEREHEMQVADPDPQVDPTREAVREPLREGIQPPPEHRQPPGIAEEQPPGFEERQQARQEVDDPRAAEGPPHTPTDQPLAVDQPIPEAVDDRPEGIDPTEEPLIDPIGDPQPESDRRPQR